MTKTRITHKTQINAIKMETTTTFRSGGGGRGEYVSHTRLSCRLSLSRVFAIVG